MKELKLHSEGQKDHLTSLKEKYKGLENSVQKNPNLTKAEKQVELKKISVQRKTENKNSSQNFY